MHYIHQHSGYEGLEDSHEQNSNTNATIHDTWGGLDDGGGKSAGSGSSSSSSLDEDEERESVARAAIFYSINSTQPGLRGIELGNSLIKRVPTVLLSEMQSIVL